MHSRRLKACILFEQLPSLRRVVIVTVLLIVGIAIPTDTDFTFNVRPGHRVKLGTPLGSIPQAHTQPQQS
jgi:hypothetical protein